MINPDPGEGDGQTSAMGTEYWYPLYEKMVKMDIPGLIHSASCKNPRESFHSHFITEESIAILSLADSNVFKDFPKLKLIVSHGGCSVPYQVGRWRSQLRGPNDTENFDGRLKQLYFDTALYYLDQLASRPNLPDEIRQVIPYEKALTLLESSKASRNPEKQVEQLRGRAGARQVPEARVALAENAGGMVRGEPAAVAIHILSA